MLSAGAAVHHAATCTLQRLPHSLSERALYRQRAVADGQVAPAQPAGARLQLACAAGGACCCSRWLHGRWHSAERDRRRKQLSPAER